MPWMTKKLVPGRGEDDLILEIVVFIGTSCTDSSAALFICNSGVLQCLIELLKAKQEDDEMVLQVRRNLSAILSTSLGGTLSSDAVGHRRLIRDRLPYWTGNR